MGVEETGYSLISVYEDFTPDKTQKRFGSLVDWSFGALGIPTFSTELWDVFGAAGIEREDFYPLRPFSEEDQLKLLHWQDEALDGDGFMPWTPFEHPQLGSVELGGWNRIYTFRNPPPARYLEEMARTNCQFTLRHAAAAPHLRLRNLQVIPESDGVYHISAVVDNTGFLPTSLSEQAKAMEAAAPVKAWLTGPEGMRFIAGQSEINVGHLAGRSSRPRKYSRFYDWPNSNAAVEWTISLTADQPADLQLTAGCPRAGTVRATIHIDRTGRSNDRTPVQLQAVERRRKSMAAKPPSQQNVLMDASFYRKRISRIQEHLETQHLDGLLLLNSNNIMWATGFFHIPSERPIGCYFPVDSDPVFFVPFLEKEHAEGNELGDRALLLGVPWRDPSRSLDVAADRRRAGGH